MEAKLIKVDRNGSKHFEGDVTCDRCGGRGYYAIAMCNGSPVLSPLDGGVCWKCFGKGTVHGKWIERTPEYQAKLDARREAKRKAEQEKWEAEQAKLEAERAEAQRLAEKAEAEAEAKRLAEKAISQYIGSVGERMSITATYIRSAYFEVPSFRGYGTETMFVHTFKADGNVIVWKTSKALNLECDKEVEITGTVKDHSEYRDEKQTVLTRCKIK